MRSPFASRCVATPPNDTVPDDARTYPSARSGTAIHERDVRVAEPRTGTADTQRDLHGNQERAEGDQRRAGPIAAPARGGGTRPPSRDVNWRALTRPGTAS